MENEDLFIIDQFTWSFSRMSSYHQCPLEWRNKYINLEETTGSCYAEFGSFCHKILEMFFKGELDEFELATYYQEHYQDEVRLPFPSNYGDTCYEKGLRYFENFSFDKNKYEVLGVEREVKFTIGDKYNCIGFIDVLLRDKEDGGIVIADHKSSSIKILKSGKISKSDQEHFESFKRQLYLYSIPIEKEYGNIKSLRWNLFKDGTFIEIPWDRNEFEETKKWAEETIKDIENITEYPARPDYFYCTTLCATRSTVPCPYKRLGMIYDGIYAKCYNPKNKDFFEYGAAGIEMCDDWKNDKQEFFKWALESGYNEDMILKRYDESQNYDFFNCYWEPRPYEDNVYF